VPTDKMHPMSNHFQVAEYKRQAAANDLETQYKAIINRLEKQVKEYQRTTNRVQKVHREALQDRSSFEKAKLKAEEAMKAAAEAAQKEADKRQNRIAELEGVVARLTATSGDEESPLSKTERLLEESQKKVKTLEKRLENAQNETDYIRDVYQDVNSKSGGMAAEIKTLRKQNEDLEQKASENLERIHQIQADAAKEAHLNHIAELKTLVREQEYELGRLCEERTLRNGRPSTRQASVPRSPRTGMMSPRPGRGFGGSASRGTSPALPGHDGNGSGGIPGVQFMGQQPGNGRWDHLRD
jgi:chromosome segregation ATPase